MDSPHPELQRAAIALSKFGWSGRLSTLGAAVTSFWFLYLVFQTKGFWVTLLALLFLSSLYGIGPAAMFAIASTFLCFYFHVVGVWLPVLAYVLAALSLYVALQVMRARRAIDPFEI